MDHDGHSTATTYDKNGNAKTLLVPTQVTHSFTANGVNKVKTNAIGNRVAKLVDGIIVEKYLWLNKTTLAAIYDKNDNLVQRFEYGLSNTPVSFTQDGNKYYITSDHLGSARTISDDSGNVLKAIEYDSFGNVISDTNSALEIPFGFAGGLHDKDTNLIRFGYRDYDPEAGRWTARDPIGFAGGDTNLYGYVASDPVNFVDPTGLIVVDSTPMAVAHYVLGDVYHVGDTPIHYSTKCNGKTCTTTYTSDGEFGEPFKYEPFSWTETYPDRYIRCP